MSGGASALEAALDEITDKIDEFRDGVNSALGMVPGFLRDLIGSAIEKWEEFCARVDEFFSLVNEMFSYGWGDADALRASATAWRDSVADLMRSAYDLLSNDAIKADTSWRGGAGDVYAAKFQGQIDELRNSEDASIVVAELLEGHADALDTFYSNLTAGLIGAGASLAGLVISIIGLVPPFTPAGIAGIIISAIGLAVSLYYLFTNEWNDLQRMSDLGAEGAQTARADARLEWPRIVNA